MKVTKEQYDDIRSNLAEGFHTAFRKASDHPNAHKIWVLIRELPPKSWGSVIDFVMDGTFEVKK